MAFRSGQRIVVADPSHPLHQRRGRIEQVRLDGVLRVVIERGLPESESIILDGIRYHNQTLLRPECCERLLR